MLLYKRNAHINRALNFGGISMIKDSINKTIGGDKKRSPFVTFLAVIGAITLIVAAVYAIYRFVTPDYYDDDDYDEDDEYEEDEGTGKSASSTVKKAVDNVSKTVKKAADKAVDGLKSTI